MMHLEFGGARIPVRAGETIIGSAPGCAIMLEGEGILPRHAIVVGTAQGAAALRTASPDAEILINGIRLGADPTPVLHGDKIQIGPHEILAVDSRRIGSTQLFDSGAFTDLTPPRPSTPPAPGATGGRLVCLTDGREYTMAAATLVFGRDAGSDVVVTGTEVSRRHAEIQSTPEGYVLNDLSVNGTYVNGERVGRQYLLARADVIRIGHDEFRFYADVAPPPPRGRRSVPPVTAPQPPTGAGSRLADTLLGLPQPAPSATVTPTTPQVAPLASLLVRSGAMKGRRLPVKVPVVNIGRADFNDVVISDPSVSTSHAKLQRRDEVWVLSDLGSTNGTFVDGERLSGEVALGPGATIKFGEVAVLFEPLDANAPVRRSSGTQVLSAVLRHGDAEPAAEPETAPARSRRPIRAATPRPSGPPTWLIAALVVIAGAVAFFLLH
jgi:pSer/pThr/pTyr-binding forkhead associated (FHA) protein